MKGMALIAEVLFLAIVISLIFLVYALALPIIYSMQVSSAFEQSKSFMLELDDLIQQVASQGKGSRRSIYLTMGAGATFLNESTDTIRWVLNTDSMIVSPRSMQQVGNLIIGSNLNTMAYLGSYKGNESYVLENERLKVFIKKIGSAQSPQYYNTSQLLLGIYNKDLDEWMQFARLEISIDNTPDSMNGTGYTELVHTGYALPRGEVLAHINTSYAFMSNYTISFVLESGADFLILEAEEA